MFLLREDHLSKDASLELPLNRIPIPNPKKKKEKNLIISIIARVVDPRDRVFEWRVGVGRVAIQRFPSTEAAVTEEKRAWKLRGNRGYRFLCRVEEIEGHERDAAFFLYSRRIRRTKRRTTWCWPSSSRLATWAWCPSFDTASTCPIYRRNRSNRSVSLSKGRGWIRSRELESFRSSADEGIKKKKKKESEGKKRVS